MKYDIRFFEDKPDDERDDWGGDEIDLDYWKGENTVPNIGDTVFMQHGGWRTTMRIAFSATRTRFLLFKRRYVMIQVEGYHGTEPPKPKPKRSIPIRFLKWCQMKLQWAIDWVEYIEERL